MTQNTVGAVPAPSIQENLTTASDGTVTGTITTRDLRAFTVSGYVNTSHGRVDTIVRQALLFSNQQTFDVEAAKYVQQIKQDTEVSTSTEVHQGFAVSVSGKQFSYPLNLGFSVLQNADGSGSQTTTVDQRYDTLGGGIGIGGLGLAQVSNHVSSADTLLFDSTGTITGYQNRNSSQTYTSRSLDGGCYSKTITAANGVLTGVTGGVGCH